MTTIFSVIGPLKIPTYEGKAARSITDANVREFWDTHAGVAKHRGCYVFGIRAGKGFTPSYVGKATKTFKQEAFAPHKLTRYQQALADYRKGTPIMFFVIAPKKKGAPNNKHIGQLEVFLIQAGLAANPDLLNIKGTKQESWGISGVLRGGKGKRSAAAHSFRALMKIHG